MVITISVYLAAMLGSSMAGPPLPVIIGSLLILAITMAQVIRAMRVNREVLSLLPGGSLLIQQDSAGWARLEIEKSLVSSWLVIVRAKAVPTGKAYYLVYVYDSMDSMSFRRLKVYLTGVRWQQDAD
jgi:hypothetical protein